MTPEEVRQAGRERGAQLRAEKPLTKAEAQAVFHLLLAEPPKSRKQAA